jgi:hypothetical protein
MRLCYVVVALRLEFTALGGMGTGGQRFFHQHQSIQRRTQPPPVGLSKMR